MIQLIAVLAYLAIGSFVAWFGIRRGWGLFVTQFEKRPDTGLILVFWPIWVAVYGLAGFLEWIDNLADSATYKRNH